VLALYRTFRDLARTQWLTAEQLENIRLRKLQALVAHAYEYVPYYRDLFTREGLHPRDIRTLADLSAVPVTTKHDLLDAGPGQITCTNIPSGDLVAERTQKSFRRTGDNALEVGYEITLRNHKDRKVTMVLRERLFGDWTIVTESDPGTTADSATREYRVVLDPDAERTVSYTARIRL